MVSKCLNPHCSAILHHMSQGRLFRVDFTEAGKKSAPMGKVVVASIRNKSCPIEHFWLCEDCAKSMTIALGDAGEIHLVSLQSSALKPSAARSPETHKRREAAAS
jgi:hypothetical protein